MVEEAGDRTQFPNAVLNHAAAEGDSGRPPAGGPPRHGVAAHAVDHDSRPLGSLRNLISQRAVPSRSPHVSAPVSVLGSGRRGGVLFLVRASRARRARRQQPPFGDCLFCNPPARIYSSLLDSTGTPEPAKDGNAFAREMLDERTKKAEAWHQNAVNHVPYFKPADPITCATLAQDILEGRASVSQAREHKHQPLILGPASLVGGSLTNERERMAAQVFQPGYRLPTMSIEEAGLREMKMMEKWQERIAKIIKEVSSAWYKDGASSSAQDEDAEEEKARARDDWKDDNPRGAGNKKLTLPVAELRRESCALF